MTRWLVWFVVGVVGALYHAVRLARDVWDYGSGWSEAWSMVGLGCGLYCAEAARRRLRAQ